MSPTDRARVYFGVQALAGLIWWVLVFVSDAVGQATLGEWSPAVLVVPDMVLFVGASAGAALSGDRVWAVVAAAWTTAVTVALAAVGLAGQTAGWGVVAMTLASLGSLAAAATLWFGRLPTGWFFVGPFSFEEADDRTRTGHLVRSLVQLVAFWSFFFLVVPLVLTAIERRLDLDLPALASEVWRVIGAVLFVVGSAAGLWSCVTMAWQGHGTPLPAETARDLVVVGPYTYLRNPMAVAGVVQVVGVGLWLGSWLVVAVGLAGAVLWDVVIRPVEEADLAARFGEPYERYRAAVRCWVPRRPTAGAAWRRGGPER